MTIYQGEELNFEGHILDDMGQIMSGISANKISLLLKRDDTVYAIWCNRSVSVQGHTVMPISINSSGRMSFTLPSSITMILPKGSYTLEQKTTDDNGIVIGVSEKQIKVCESSIGNIQGL